MRIAKKLFSCLALFLLCIVCLLADAPKVRAAEFLTADDGTFLYITAESWQSVMRKKACNSSLPMTALCS